MVPDGRGEMKAGKSCLHSKPVNEIRTNVLQLHCIALESGFPGVADSGGTHV